MRIYKHNTCWVTCLVLRCVELWRRVSCGHSLPCVSEASDASNIGTQFICSNRRIFSSKQADFFLRAIVLLMFLQFVGRILIVKKITIHRIVLIWGSTLLRLCTLFNMTKESCILVFWYAAITNRSAQRQEKLFSPRKSFQKPQNTCTLKQSLLTGLHAWELLLHYWKLVVRAVELFRNWCAPKCKEWMIHISFYKNAIWFIFFCFRVKVVLKHLYCGMKRFRTEHIHT